MAWKLSASMLWSAKRTASSEAYGMRQHLERILEAHDAKADRAVAEVGAAGFGDGVEIDVDDVVEHPHRGADRAGQPGPIEGRPADMVDEVDRAEIADGDLAVRRVERDLGAEVRRVDDAGMALRRADVTGGP